MAESSADRGADAQFDEADLSRAFLTSIHPSGDPRIVLSIGPPEDRHTNDSKGDVVVLTMTPAQCRNAAELESTIERGLSALAPNGILWMDAPGKWRSALRRRLRRSGMVVGVPTVARTRGAARIDIPLTGRGLRFALTSGKVSQRWRLVVAMVERVPWGSAMLLRFLPGVGFAAFRPGTTPFGWLTQQVAVTHDVDFAVKTSWRGAKAPFLVFALAKDATFVAKRGGPDCHTSVSHEAAMLTELGAGLAMAGLELPRLIDCHKTPRLYSLIETAVPGRPMASWIREGHHRNLGALVDRLATWLGRWNRQTVRHVELTPALSEQLILSAARELAGTISRGTEYLEWLSRQTEQLLGQKVPLVAAHNDLTMANVLGDRSGIRSIVDWEAASHDGLPLADFHYAVCDAATAINGGDRLEAFRACFRDPGDLRQLLRQGDEQLREIVGGPPEWLELCFHANWLRHAANEQARSSSVESDDAFIAIAGDLARSVVDE